MTNQTLIILADTAFQPGLRQGLDALQTPYTPKISVVSDLHGLQQAIKPTNQRTRLIAFCTDVIVPQSLLERCTAGAYNFHPGPPEYPGIFPSCFAIYDGATRFGATVHRMTAKVDDGEIVSVSRFDIASNIDRPALDALSFEAISSLFKKLSPNLLDLSSDLLASGDQWTGPVRTRAEFNQLCQLPENVSREEFEIRYRAVSEGPDHALTIQLHGHRFRLDNQRDQESVLRGGQTTKHEAKT